MTSTIKQRRLCCKEKITLNISIFILFVYVQVHACFLLLNIAPSIFTSFEDLCKYTDNFQTASNYLAKYFYELST